MNFGVGLMLAIRNPVSHESNLQWSTTTSMEFLAAWSVFARWVEECEVCREDPGSADQAIDQVDLTTASETE